MSVSDSYIEFALERLGSVGQCTSRRMFGGAGIYNDGLFFAIIENDTLRFKVNDTNRPDYEEAGMEPFKPYKDKAEIMQYYEVPPDVLEDDELLAEWAEKALDVARSAALKKASKKKRK